VSRCLPCLPSVCHRLAVGLAWWLVAWLSPAVGQAQNLLGDLRARYLTALNESNYDESARYASQLGEVYRNQGNSEEAAKYYAHAVNYLRLTNKTREKLDANRALGEVHLSRQEYGKAIMAFKEVQQAHKELGNREDYLRTILLLADLHGLAKMPQNAVNGLTRLGEPAAYQLGVDSLRLRLYRSLAKYGEQSKNSAQAFLYQKKATELADSLRTNLASSLAKEKKIQERQLANEQQKAEVLLASKDKQLSDIVEQKAEVEQAKAATEVRAQQLLTETVEAKAQVEEKNKLLDAERLRFYGAIAAFLLVSVLGFLLYRALRANKQYLAQVEEQNQEILAQKEDIAEKNLQLQRYNQNMVDSLRYAGHIQRAILPAETALLPLNYDFFLLHRPKDIVSGDFYWSAPINGGKSALVAVADCTGHGVPGAFMSIIGHNLLYDIVYQRKLTQPGEILEQINLGVRAMLRQENGFNDDGMDIGLCIVHARETPDGKSRVEFAGAKLSLHVVENHRLTNIKGTNRSIGGRQRPSPRPYEEHTLHLAAGAMLYLVTDGFIDQRNAEKEKFGTPRLIEQFPLLAMRPVPKQKDMLVNTLEQFMGQEPQLDDITILGIKV
jgi:serine phosphatase RsbU (regulator of sigma subunit)